VLPLRICKYSWGNTAFDYFSKYFLHFAVSKIMSRKPEVLLHIEKLSTNVCFHELVNKVTSNTFT